MSYLQNFYKPQGRSGRVMLSMMNLSHTFISRWGLSLLPLAKDAHVLDAGCGGGANLARLLRLCPDGQVAGLDYSPESVAASQKKNAAAIRVGRCSVLEGNIAALPFPAEHFDVVTAFETVYFWPDLTKSFREVFRVLRPGGRFFLCNEYDGTDPSEERWPERINGMTIYRAEQLEQFLTGAGFSRVQVNKKRHWMCVTAWKAEAPSAEGR